MDLKQYRAALEAVLFAVAEPVSTEKLAEILGIEHQVVERLCGHLRDEYAEEEHGIQLPQISVIFSELKKRGMCFDSIPVTYNEAVDLLKQV